MIDVKTAVQRAVEYVREFQDYLPRSDIRLEETEFVDPNIWQITLSLSDALPVLGIPGGRIYKMFRINADTGQVVSMKARSLATTQ